MCAVRGGCFPQLRGHFSNVVVWDSRRFSVSLDPYLLPILCTNHVIRSLRRMRSYDNLILFRQLIFNFMSVFRN